jgi:hypothetical protein
VKRRRLRRAPRLAAEMAVIVFSVLFALAANEWRQAQSRNATVATVQETIRAETVANRAQVERAVAHHRDLVAQLRGGGIVMARLGVRDAGIDTTSAAAFARTLHAAARAYGQTSWREFDAERLDDGDWRVVHDQGEFRVSIVGDSATVRGRGNISLRPPFLVDSAWETAQITQAAVHMDPEIVASLARIRQLQRMLDGTVDRLVDILYATASGGDIISALQDLIMFEQSLLDAYDGMLAALPTGPGS